MQYRRARIVSEAALFAKALSQTWAKDEPNREIKGPALLTVRNQS